MQNAKEREQKEAAAALAEAGVAHAAAVRAKAAELEAAQAQLGTEQRERANAMQQGEKSVADVRAQMLFDMNRKVSDAKRAHQAELQQLRSSLEATASAASASHKVQVEELQRKHEMGILRARQVHAEVCGPLWCSGARQARLGDTCW